MIAEIVQQISLTADTNHALFWKCSYVYNLLLTLQDADEMCLFSKLSLTKENGTLTSPRATGGNLHNHNIDMYARVSLYKAVEVSNQKMSHVGDYVAYTGENEVY